MKHLFKNLFLTFAVFSLAPQVVVAMNEFKEEEKEREVKEYQEQSHNDFFLQLQNAVNEEKTYKIESLLDNNKQPLTSNQIAFAIMTLYQAVNKNNLSICSEILSKEEIQNSNIIKPKLIADIFMKALLLHHRLTYTICDNPILFDKLLEGLSENDLRIIFTNISHNASERRLGQIRAQLLSNPKILSKIVLLNNDITRHIIRERLLSASQEGNHHIVQAMLDCPGFNNTLNNQSARQSLFAAVNAGHLNVIQTMLGNQAFMNHIDNAAARQSLAAAAQAGNFNIVQFMLNHGPFMNHINNNNWFGGAGQALQGAAQAGHLNIVQLMIGNQQFMNQIGNGDAESSLQAATQAGHLNIVQLMIGNQQFMNHIRNWGACQALQAATNANNQHIINFMLNHPEFVSKFTTHDTRYITSALRTLHPNSRFIPFKVFFSYLKSWSLLKKFVLPTFGKWVAIYSGCYAAGLLITLGIGIPTAAAITALLNKISYGPALKLIFRDLFNRSTLKFLAKFAGGYVGGFSALLTFLQLAL